MLASEYARLRAIALVTIDRAPLEIYDYWRDFANLPRFMHQVEHVRVLDRCRSEWLVRRLPAHHALWSAEIVDDVPGVRLCWQTVGVDDINSAASLTMGAAHSGRGTDVLFDITYSTFDDRRAKALGKLFHHDPCRQAFENLRALKLLLEGEQAARSPLAQPALVERVAH
jgi:uncharacterized membrane protein